MSFSATRVALPPVGGAGDQGPDLAPCADSQIGGLLWCGQFAHRQIHTHDVPDLQCHHFSALPAATVAPAHPRAPHDPCARQRSLSSRRPSGPIPAPLPANSDAPVPAALQSAARPDRASLEADPAPRNAQPLLCNAPRSLAGRQRLLQSMAPSKQDTLATMLHYLRRCV